MPPEAQKRKKYKASKPTTKTTLKEDDYEFIATRLQDVMKESFQAMQTSQDKLKRTIDQRLLELKALTEKTATIQSPPTQVTTGEISTPSTSHEEVLAKDCINTVLIPSGSIRITALMIDVQIKVRQPVEVNLAQFPVDQLQMIQQQIAAELKDREIETYK